MFLAIFSTISLQSNKKKHLNLLKQLKICKIIETNKVFSDKKSNFDNKKITSSQIKLVLYSIAR